MQAYPAMEYRFTPERITVTTDDVVCFVWSGENFKLSNYLSSDVFETQTATGRGMELILARFYAMGCTGMSSCLKFKRRV